MLMSPLCRKRNVALHQHYKGLFQGGLSRESAAATSSSVANDRVVMLDFRKRYIVEKHININYDLTNRFGFGLSDSDLVERSTYFQH